VPFARPALLALVWLMLLAPVAAAQDLDLPTPDANTPTVERPSITVTGQASAVAPNDAARVVFSMRARRRTGPAALRASARRARRVIARLRAAGIEEEDMRTLRVRLTRYHRGGLDGPVIYAIARNSVRVFIRDLRRTQALIDAAVAAGATRVAGPSFFLFDRTPLYRQVLIEAFDDAEVKAEELADEAGYFLGEIISMREGTGEGQTGFAVEGEESPQARTPARPGTTLVRATVTVEFELE
jgi:uncharacterized protein YggE